MILISHKRYTYSNGSTYHLLSGVQDKSQRTSERFQLIAGAISSSQAQKTPRPSGCQLGNQKLECLTASLTVGQYPATLGPSSYRRHPLSVYRKLAIVKIRSGSPHQSAQAQYTRKNGGPQPLESFVQQLADPPFFLQRKEIKSKSAMFPAVRIFKTVIKEPNLLSISTWLVLSFCLSKAYLLAGAEPAWLQPLKPDQPFALSMRCCNFSVTKHNPPLSRAWF